MMRSRSTIFRGTHSFKSTTYASVRILGVSSTMKRGRAWFSKTNVCCLGSGGHGHGHLLWIFMNNTLLLQLLTGNLVWCQILTLTAQKQFRATHRTPRRDEIRISEFQSFPRKTPARANGQNGTELLRDIEGESARICGDVSASGGILLKQRSSSSMVQFVLGNWENINYVLMNRKILIWVLNAWICLIPEIVYLKIINISWYNNRVIYKIMPPLVTVEP